ncbi:Ornithine decarboxylase [Basidiobolus ranarum]|uniref:Ornithine decarboxylase n=1 Tax=Basidiobolus ranarum TaxID=34480 RepID=A0ABR2X504_9FUNG
MSNTVSISSITLSAENSTYAVRTVLEEKLKSKATLSNDDPFIVADLRAVTQRLEEWREHLPMVEPFYAVKCNPDPEIIKIFCAAGIGFDCASQEEMEQTLKHGVSPSKIIFANVVKSTVHLRCAKKLNVRLMTFDNVELYKIQKHYPEAQAVIRILIEDTKAEYSLSDKAGAPMSSVSSLLQVAKTLGIDVVGVSFHVGCRCFDPNSYRNALTQAREVFELGATYGYQFHTLDIGGGFPGDKKTDGSIDIVASAIKEELKAQFPSNVRVIAEPGRYLVAPAYTLATCVIGRQLREEWQVSSKFLDLLHQPNRTWMYYLNEGLYGSFSRVPSKLLTVKPKILQYNGEFIYTPDCAFEEQLLDTPRFESVIWGPTCDTTDCLFKTIVIPELKVNDWLVFESMGAYSTCASTEFNGFKKTEIIYINTPKFK